MQFTFKLLSPEAVPRALAKAERYRLLNQPGEAESICLDALEVEPNNQEAIAMLVLAITEQFGRDQRLVCTPGIPPSASRTSTSDAITGG